MTEVKHTPGPWTVDPNHKWTGYGDVDAVIMADDQIVSTIYGGRELQPQIKALPTFESCRANAALIAAAPDMLAVMKSLWRIEKVSRPEDGAMFSMAISMDQMEAMSAAIAKAEGR